MTPVSSRCLALLLAACTPLAAAAPAGPGASCGAPAANQRFALVRPSEDAFMALVDSVVVRSPYGAGDVVLAGNQLFSLTAMSIDTSIADLQNRIADLELKLLNIRNISAVNGATLAEYERRNGPLTAQALHRVTRQDEIDIVAGAIAKLTSTQRRFEALRRSAGGPLPYPVLLLSDPPRVAETVKAGAALVRYAYLDRVTLSVFARTSDGPVPASVFAELAGQCVRFRYLRTVAEQKTNRFQLLYRASIKPVLFAAVAELARSPGSALPLFSGPGKP